MSTAADYLRFAHMLAGGGEVDGVRVLAPQDGRADAHQPPARRRRPAGVALPGGYGEVGFDGMGFGLTVAVSQGPAATQAAGSAGEFMWGGLASTIFWVDPVEDVVAVFMTQLIPSGTFNFRGQLKSLVYGALVGLSRARPTAVPRASTPTGAGAVTRRRRRSGSGGRCRARRRRRRG